jgi:UDP-glucose 4-epimerase
MALYIVTGAAGFIGAAVSQKLITQGHRVVTIDNLSTGYRENVPKGVEFYQADCQDISIYQKLPCETYDAIFHIAGQSSGEVSFDDPSYDLRTNTESTLHLLKFALSVGCDRLIYASSMSVYGVKPDRPVAEDEVPIPASFYGVGKLASEHYLHIYEQYGVRSTSLRLFNVYGPGQNLSNMRQGMVSIYLAQMLEKRHIHVKGSGSRYRDLVYIDDVVDAFLACLHHPESAGQVINIGTGIRTSVEELIQKLIHTYSKSVTCEFKGSTPGDLHGIYADTSRAKKLLNFQPKFSLAHGLTQMLKWATELTSHNQQ